MPCSFFTLFLILRKVIEKGGMMMANSRKSRRKRNIRLLAFLALIVLLVALFSYQYRPLMLDTAIKLAQNTANEVINQTVCDLLTAMNIQYNDLVTIAYNDSGVITALHANATTINQLKAQAALSIREALSKSGAQRISVPLGTLCGSTLLSGLGPEIECLSLMNSIPQIALQYHFDGAGINQTLHSIVMVVTVPLSVTLPLQSGETETKTSFLIGETILVGEVPDNYTNVISDPEVADDIFNYGDAG